MSDRPQSVGDLTTELDPRDGRSVVSGEQSYLVVRRGGSSRVITLADGDEVTIGRDPNATIVVDHLRVSRNHARIVRKGRTLRLVDLGSRNGTSVSGVLVKDAERLVGGGDVIAVGDVEIVVAVASSLPPPEGSEQVVPDVDRLIVAEPSMVKLHGLVQKLARAPTNVLVVGETGAGKEVIAEQLHRLSPRASAPFVTVNCAAVPEALIESELFGHERGAFTGADRRRVGFFEAANGGTLLLDEIGELPLATQAKLLRVLESRAVTRLGDVKPVQLDVRVVCATNKDLKTEVAAGRFREDLFYRISAFTIRVPPLRERPIEIALLAQLFASEIARRMGQPPPAIGADAIQVLSAYAWPGNVRELRNAIEHAVIVSDGAELRAEHLPETLSTSSSPAMRGRIESLERANIEAALAAAGGNQTRAAEALGISRRTLVYKLTKYGLRK